MFVCLFLSQFACFVSSYCILLFLGCLFLIRDRKAVESNGRENEEDLGGVGGAETIIITIWKNLFSVKEIKKRESAGRSYQCLSSWPNIFMMPSLFKNEQERAREKNAAHVLWNILKSIGK